MAKEKIAVPLPNALETLAAQFADAMAEGVALQAQLGDLAREAAQMLADQPDNLAPFTDACRQLCLAHGLAEGSVDKTISHLRGVIRAILGGANLPADATLRVMYEAIPKDPSKGGRKPRQPASGAKGKSKGGLETISDAVNPPKLSRADIVRALFGHMDESLLAAVEYAVRNEAMFTRWAEASAKAAQAGEPKPTAAPLRKAA